MIVQQDSLEYLKTLEDSSIDHIITDPPYLIDFMGKGWDSEDNVAGSVDYWKEALRVCKSGSYALVFGHSRTHHRVMVAMENAGWEIRDCLMWLYGSGFPKSHNLGGGWGSALKPAYEPIIMARKPFKGSLENNWKTNGLGGLNIDACRVGTDGGGTICNNRDEEGKCLGHKNEGRSTSGETFHSPLKQKTITTKGPKFKSWSDDPEKTRWHNQGFNKLGGNTYETKETTGRFPANIILSHSEGCVLVGSVEDTFASNDFTAGTYNTETKVVGVGTNLKHKPATQTTELYDCEQDCPVRILDEQSGITKSSPVKHKDKHESTRVGKSTGFSRGNDTNHNDKGGASRFFYTAKVSSKERNYGCDNLPEKQTIGGGGTNDPNGDDVCGKYGSVKVPNRNHHPTIKPIKLMEYLVKLVSKEGQTILDPFAGSGSTGLACINLNRNYVLVEREEEYVVIIKARINAWKENK